ncbi:retropepsin-like aspartic protease [Prosthecobacter sp.]|uniref:retropepsin-like aspartic protease n=1 Tax=Prosthecobacter sp. TaxID=1965333 RepID=UPI001D379A29|nr:retropepsin-like aspartic protease [Prosthecobacter sp.]MCB1279380.1 clan AA aspartic protease [Prosthecobacter sp.]
MIRHLFIFVLGAAMTACLIGCADSFAIKNEAVPAELEQKLHAQAVPASELKLTKAGLNVRTVSVPPSEGVLKVPMYYENGIPHIKVSLNGRKPKKFMLDTGATFSVFDAEQAVEYGLRTVPQVRPTMAGVLGREPGMAALIPTVQIGTWRLENLPCIIRMQRTAWGSGILKEHLGVSVLGVQMAANHCKYLTLDFLKGQVEFGFTRSYPGQVRKHLHKTNLSMKSGVPTTVLKFGRVSWEAVVDSGSVFGVQLDQRVAQVLGYKNGGWNVGGNYLITGVGGAQTPKDASVRVLEFQALGLFGSYYPFAEVDVMPGPSRLGTYLLEDYRVTLDFERKLLWIEWG